MSDPRINIDSNDNSNVDDKNNYLLYRLPLRHRDAGGGSPCKLHSVPDCPERARGGPDEGNNEDEKGSNASLLLLLSFCVLALVFILSCIITDCFLFIFEYCF